MKNLFSKIESFFKRIIKFILRNIKKSDLTSHNPKDSDMTEDSNISYKFNGYIEVSGNGRVKFFAIIEYAKFDSANLTVNLFWTGDKDERVKGARFLDNLSENHIWLYSSDPLCPNVELLGIHGVVDESKGDYIYSSSIVVSAIQAGIGERFFENDEALFVNVLVQPSGILISDGLTHFSETGAINIDKIEKNEVNVFTSFGELQARESYDFFEPKETSDREVHRIQRSCMSGEIIVPQGKSLFEVHEELKLELQQYCISLSLCYRHPVSLFEINYISLKRPSPISNICTYRRKRSKYHYKNVSDELIGLISLTDDGLMQLRSSIYEGQYSDDLQRAIQFISQSYISSLEEAFFMTFSAMETVIGCCLENLDSKIISDSNFKRLRRKIRDVISENLDSNDAEKVYEKLPELNREALTRRINESCSRFHPKIDDLWPVEGFESGIKRASKIRNGLFHSSQYSVDESMYSDLVRIRIFAERLLLKYLQWSDDKIYKWYDQELRRINSKPN